jgi:hypothetical protein
MKKLVEVIDLTPTWGEMVPVLITLLEGNFEQRDLARTELVKMATCADTYNAMVRANMHLHADFIGLATGVPRPRG